MSSAATTEFWVVFDTATRPEYYGDVHKLLALPEGALLEYQYRDVRVDPSALAALRAQRDGTERVLFVYAQRSDYRRGDPDPDADTPANTLLWQPLRLGSLVATWKSGEHNHLQFRLDGYPEPDPTALAPIVDELAARGAAPFKAWVARSRQSEALRALTPSDPAAAWQGIVDRLSAAPMQFGGDMFWRVDPPRRSRFRAGASLPAKYVRREGHEDALDHRYVVSENLAFALQVHTHEPYGAPPRTGAPPKLDVAVADEGPLHKPNAAQLELRRNSELPIRLESKHSADSERRLGALTLRSSDTLTAAAGGGIALEFFLRLSRWKRWLGALVMFLGAVAAAVGAVLKADKTITTPVLILIAVVGLALLGLGQRLYSGKWAFKT